MLAQTEVLLMNGAKLILQTLNSFGVDTVFGYPGGIVLKLYDELYNQNTIRHILVRHEQSAVHAAEGYARATGKCGVVLVTSGPGATNTVTGIANAYLDGYPLIVITGQVSKNLLGKDAFQEANICEIAKSCSKAVFQITSAKDIQMTLLKAFKTANSGKKGPVVVDITNDVFFENAFFNDISYFLQDAKPQISTTDCDRIINQLLSSSKPVIVAGGGVTHSKSALQLQIFAKKFNIPVVSTMMGLGNFPNDDENYFGMIGIFGDNSANEIVRNSDLVLSLGARFNDRIMCKFNDIDMSSKFVQIDINKNEIARIIVPKDYTIADVGDFLTQAIQYDGDFSSWLDEAQKYKELNIPPQKNSNMLHTFEVMQKIEEYTKDKDIIFTSEVGQHQLWAIKNLKFRQNRKIFVSGGSGTMGFGLPAAIGASVAERNKPVVCIAGDGSFQMSVGELATCKNLNIKIFIINNGYLGMVRQLQEKKCDSRYSETKISNPDFVKLAQSYGIDAIKVSSYDNIDNALDNAFASDKPFLIDFEVEPIENV